ncbi:MAG: carboxy terminal-processing peptidase, partial [Verrucomicrobia bacterium]|nr:carboxy terminal-processing peptidase [Verrucomicrobiota bacterium]
GFDIFQRFFERFEQRTRYAQGLLKTETFKFDDTVPILLNRRDAAFPADLKAAEDLWRDRLRYEYLEEKLALIDEQEQAKKSREETGAENPAVKNSVSAETAETNGVPVVVEASAPKSLDAQVREKLDRRYARNLKFFAEWDLSTLGHVYDPHTDYMGRAALEQFSINMNLALFGIGAQLRALDGYCTIERLLPGGPAEKSKKLKEKERIVAVAQADGEPVDVVDMSLNKIVQLIRGPKGTEVQLTVVPPEGAGASERRVVKLIRDEIPLEEQAAKAKLIEIPTGEGKTKRIGIIDLPTFYAPMDIVSRPDQTQTRHSTSEDVALLIEKLKQEGIEGLILDLRRNGGGSLEEAIRLTGMFIKKGPVVQVRDYDGKIGLDQDRDPSILYDGPMMVLTSRGSASASEILAGALQDYGRAVVVGDVSTHGKGTVQSLNQLGPVLRLAQIQEDPGALKVTIRKFYRINGESTQLRGVKPDIVLPAVANVMEDVGEAGLENPLEWDTINSARFSPVNMVGSYLPELRKQSEARLAVDKDFEYIREDMERFQEMQARKTVLLNETERSKELAEAKDRSEARAAERRSRPSSGSVTYEISLKDVALPGLPEPVGSSNAVHSATATGADPHRLMAGEDESDEAATSEIDPTMDEAERILLDYISALEESKVLTAGKQDS